MSSAPIPRAAEGIVAYNRDRSAFLRRNVSRLGDIFAINDTILFVADPDSVRRVLHQTNRSVLLNDTLGLRRTKRTADRIGQWTEARRRGAHALNDLSAEGSATALAQSVQDTLRRLENRTGDFVPLAQELMGRAANPFVLADAPENLLRHAKRFAKAVEQAVDRTVPLPAVIPRPSVLMASHAARAMDRLLVSIVRRRLEAGTSTHPHDFAASLLREIGPWTDPQQLARIIRFVMLAQWNAPGIALAWCIYYLSWRPDWAVRISREFTELPAALGAASLGDLRQTEAFVKEVMRVAPPVWLMVRDVIEDLTVAGHQVAAGQRVAFSPLLLHTDPRWWSGPEEFDPQRWLATTPPSPRHTYMPFGGGSRICLGAQLGLRLLVITTAIIASRYHIELSNPSVRRREGSMLTPVGLRGRLVPAGGPQPRDR